MVNFSNITLPPNRSFGVFFSFIFGSLAVYFWSKELFVFVIAFSVLGAIFLTVSVVRPQLLRPLNKIWMAFGILIGMIVSPIVLGVIFFGIFSPVGLVMRVFGRDELRLKLKSDTSHWKLRNASVFSKEHFNNQF